MYPIALAFRSSYEAASCKACPPGAICMSPIQLTFVGLFFLSTAKDNYTLLELSVLIDTLQLPLCSFYRHFLRGNMRFIRQMEYYKHSFLLFQG